MRETTYYENLDASERQRVTSTSMQVAASSFESESKRESERESERYRVR